MDGIPKGQLLLLVVVVVVVVMLSTLSGCGSAVEEGKRSRAIASMITNYNCHARCKKSENFLVRLYSTN